MGFACVWPRVLLLTATAVKKSLSKTETPDLLAEDLESSEPFSR